MKAGRGSAGAIDSAFAFLFSSSQFAARDARRCYHSCRAEETA
jgi:hypothetical protein